MNILFLNRNFYQYDSLIAKSLEVKGHRVYNYTLNMEYKYCIDSQFCKSMFNIHKISKKYIIDQLLYIKQNYMLNDLHKNNVLIDIVFVVAGQELREETLQYLKNLYPNAKFIWYMWDNTQFLKDIDY